MLEFWHFFKIFTVMALCGTHPHLLTCDIFGSFSPFSLSCVARTPTSSPLQLGDIFYKFPPFSLSCVARTPTSSPFQFLPIFHNFPETCVARTPTSSFVIFLAVFHPFVDQPCLQYEIMRNLDKVWTTLRPPPSSSKQHQAFLLYN